MNKIMIMLLTSILCVNVAQANQDDNQYLPSVKDCKIVQHTNYTICYSEKAEQPAWVAYELTSEELHKRFNRTDDFRSDNSIKTQSAQLEDYKHSGYDRGHLAPAADMEFTSTAIHESFLLSNMSPQVPAFNRGIWNNLEQQVRKWAKQYGQIYIVTAGILKGNKTIGADKVLVPNSYYKIIYVPKENKMIAFDIPNAKSNKSLKTYVTTVRNIEQQTGINFFPKFSREKSRQLELHKTALKNWHWGQFKDYSKVTYNHTYKKRTARQSHHSTNSSTHNNVIKFSRNYICHAPNTKFYARVKHFTPYKSMDECLQAGGRLPRY